MFERFKKRSETENHQIVIPDGMEFDNELLAKAVTPDGRDVKMLHTNIFQTFRSSE